MRHLSMIVVAICGTSFSVRAESLYLNSAQYQDLSAPTRSYSSASAVAPVPSYTTANVTAADSELPAATSTFPTATTSHPAVHDVGHHAHDAHGGCRSGQCQHGSLDDYPGGCCEPQGGCCAGLWANYCEQKKPCWRPESPRRHSSAQGFAIPTLGLFHCDALTSLKREAPPCNPCDQDAACDSHASAAGVSGSQTRGMETEATSPSDIPAEVPDEAGLADPEIDQPVPPDVEGTSASKLGFPFSWKLPTRSKTNPFNKPGRTARFTLPLAR
jgi:hypothetical protein